MAIRKHYQQTYLHMLHEVGLAQSLEVAVGVHQGRELQKKSMWNEITAMQLMCCLNEKATDLLLKAFFTSREITMTIDFSYF